MKLYERLLKKDEDGLYHMWPTWTTEMGGWGLDSWGRDDTLTMALVRSLVTTIVRAAEALGVDAEDRTRWRDIRDHLAPYHCD